MKASYLIFFCIKRLQSVLRDSSRGAKSFKIATFVTPLFPLLGQAAALVVHWQSKRNTAEP